MGDHPAQAPGGSFLGLRPPDWGNDTNSNHSHSASSEPETVVGTWHVLSCAHSSLGLRGAQAWGVGETYENGELENSFSHKQVLQGGYLSSAPFNKGGS